MCKIPCKDFDKISFFLSRALIAVAQWVKIDWCKCLVFVGLKYEYFKIYNENYTILKSRVVQLHHWTRPNTTAELYHYKIKRALPAVKIGGSHPVKFIQ